MIATTLLCNNCFLLYSSRQNTITSCLVVVINKGYFYRCQTEMNNRLDIVMIWVFLCTHVNISFWKLLVISWISDWWFLTKASTSRSSSSSSTNFIPRQVLCFRFTMAIKRFMFRENASPRIGVSGYKSGDHYIRLPPFSIYSLLLLISTPVCHKMLLYPTVHRLACR